ncbi:hypothetical protein F5Y10DRAFT_114139 [Nemania abortiva]|nr:hypothetical protein F5Y10DRAFT_114139 [Nemania abortiva]
MTLRKALTQGKPYFHCQVKTFTNSRNKGWPKIPTDNVISWDAFNIQNLNESYGHILDSPIPEGELNVPKPDSVLPSVRKIAKPRDISHLIKWSDAVLGPTFEFARNKLELQPGTAVKRDFTQPEKTHTRPGLANKTKAGRIKADHVIQLDDFPMQMLVLGLGRPSRYFSGRRLVHEQREGPLWQVRQLANLCAHSKTRYGYILTDEDFVACCFSIGGPESEASESKVSESKVSESRVPGWTVAVKAVPWTKAGETQLTTDLALWWLCMLAVSDPANRRLVRKEDTIEIDHWDVDLHGDDRGWVRRHHYSRLEEPIEPPPPPAYRSPSPDNAEGIAAAFGAEVGINADPAFEGFDLNADPAFEDFDLNADPGLDFLATYPLLPPFQEGDNWGNLPNFNCFCWHRYGQ